MKLIKTNTLVEYNGDLYTPEELSQLLGSDFDVVVNNEDDTWFGQAMQTLRDKSGDQ